MEANELNKSQKSAWVDAFDYAGLQKQDDLDDESDSDFKTASPDNRSLQLTSKEDKKKLSAILDAKKMKPSKAKKYFIRLLLVLSFGLALALILWFTLPYYWNWKNDDCNISEAEMRARLKSLQRSLHRKVYGQHIAIKSTFNTISSHVTDPNPDKPLVLSFHGGVGTGKTFVAELIAENLFKDGLNSKYVKAYLGPKHFYTDPNKIHETKRELGKTIESAVSACPRSLFIFDEADKILPGVLDGVAPFLGYSSNIDGIEYSKSIFIFLSNTGTSIINELTYEHLSRNKVRQDLELLNFSKPILNGAFNDQGGLFKSQMILQRNVNHFIPFLPLEKMHVLACVKDYLNRKDIYYVDAETIVKLKEFWPKTTKILAEIGCKNIGSLVEHSNPKNRNFLFDEF